MVTLLTGLTVISILVGLYINSLYVKAYNVNKNNAKIDAKNHATYKKLSTKLEKVEHMYTTTTSKLKKCMANDSEKKLKELLVLINTKGMTIKKLRGATKL